MNILRQPSLNLRHKMLPMHLPGILSMLPTELSELPAYKTPLKPRIMAKNSANSKVPSTTWQAPSANHAYKPLKIGPVIKQICEEKHITPMELERRMKLEHRNVYRLFNSKQMAMPMLFKVSEALGVNLLLEYHPTVPPVPNPLKAENAELKQENAELKQQLNEMNALRDEVKVLKGQLHILQEVMKGR
jgi:hypothetical protein